MKKLFGATLAAIMSVSMLVGCGGNAASSGGAAESAVKTESTGEVSEAATDSSASSNAEIINAGDPLHVSSMNDTEGEIIGAMMVLALRNAGYEVEDGAGTMSGTVNGRTALLEDETDIYLEYTGRGLRLIEGVDVNLYRNMETAYESVSTWDAETNNLIWLSYAPFNNTDAVAVTREFSDTNNITTWPEFAEYINAGNPVKLLCHDYFVTLSTGIPGFEENYGFKLTEDQYTIISGTQEQLLAEGVSGVNAAHIYSSSGLIPAYDLVVLEDPEHVAPIYSPCPVVRKEIIDKYPGIADVLNPIFESITLEEQIEMNARVQVNGESGVDVATEYLTSKNFIS